MNHSDSTVSVFKPESVVEQDPIDRAVVCLHRKEWQIRCKGYLRKDVIGDFSQMDDCIILTMEIILKSDGKYKSYAMVCFGSSPHHSIQKMGFDTVEEAQEDAEGTLNQLVKTNRHEFARKASAKNVWGNSLRGSGSSCGGCSTCR